MWIDAFVVEHLLGISIVIAILVWGAVMSKYK
jgi:hypothetical protein